MDLFFVLSGFLISSLLFREHQSTGGIQMKRFLVRRAFKIYPAFWFFLFSSIVIRYGLQAPQSTSAVIAELLFAQNYFPGVWPHTWSLAVEEHFYIGIAILFCVPHLLRRQCHRFEWIPMTFVVIAVSCLLLRIINWMSRPEYSHREFMFPTHLRIDSLMFGVLLAYYCQFTELLTKSKRIPATYLVCAGVALLLPAFAFSIESNPWVPVFGVILFYLGSGALVIASLRLDQSANIWLRVLASLGASSYSIYLWHMPFAVWGSPILQKITGLSSYAAWAGFYLAGSLAFGWIMHRIVEKPILAFRERYFPSTLRRSAI